MESDSLLKRPESPLHKVLCCIMPSTTSNGPTTGIRGTIGSGLQKLISSLDDVTQRPSCKDLDYEFLKNVLESPDMQNLLKVHDKVTTPEDNDIRPLNNNALKLRNDIIDELEIWSYGRESNELLSILGKPHIKALLDVHDQVAGKDFLPHLPDIPHEVDEDDGLCVKVVQLVKGDTEPLGATIQMSESDANAVKVARVMHGGAADRSGVLEVGDEVKEVNGLDMTGQSPGDVLKILSKTTGTISLKLRPSSTDKGLNDNTVGKVKACFDYNPYEDPYTPCPEASLAFVKGDILHIVSKEDAWWWQARKDGDSAVRAGLIPSRLLAEKLRGNIGSKENNKENRIISGKLNIEITDEKLSKFSPRLSKKKKGKKYIDTEIVQYPEVYYEDVDLYHPRASYHRPVVLVGPVGLHLDKIPEYISATNPDNYAMPRMCSNQPQSESKSHKIKHVSAQELEKAVRDKKILEHEEKGGYFYATTDEEVKSITSSGKTCVMTCKVETIHTIRRPDIKPFIVFIKPNPQDKTKLSGIPRKITKENDSKVIEECTRIETLYGHLIDSTVVFDKDIGKISDRIITLANNIRTEPTWVPSTWTR